jgi:hypothetical protein
MSNQLTFQQCSRVILNSLRENVFYHLKFGYKDSEKIFEINFYLIFNTFFPHEKFEKQHDCLTKKRDAFQKNW